MASGTSDLTVGPNQEGDERSRVSDPSIQASLQRTPSAVSENIAAGDEMSTGMESSIPIASSRNSEIIDAEADPSPGMESSIPIASSRNPEIIDAEADPSPGMQPSLQTTSPMLDPAEDKQSSGTGSTSSPKVKVNQFMKDLSGCKYESPSASKKKFFELKQKLKDGLRKDAVYAFLKVNNKMKAQEKVEELFDLFEAIEFVKLKIPNLEIDSYQSKFKVDYLRIDIYYRLFIQALKDAAFVKCQENPSFLDPPYFEFMVDYYLSKYFEATDFMVFLINKVQEDEDIMDPSLALQEDKTLVTKCVYQYEKETISTFICHVVNDKDKEAEDLFKTLLKHMKPSDIINRGRVYNYALKRAQKLLKVHKFLSDQRLSKRYKDVVIKAKDRLRTSNGPSIEHGYQVRKVQEFLVKLYLKDDDLRQKIDWEFVKQHDYLYLIQCVWGYHIQTVEDHVEQYNWTTPLLLNYVFTSSAAITAGGKDIMKRLLEAWPGLVNAPYKGVTALHVAAWKGNKEAIECLLEHEELDINMRTGRQFTIEEVKRYQMWYELYDGVMRFTEQTGVPLPYASELADREELIKDYLDQLYKERPLKDYIDEERMFFWIRSAISEKKWNDNREKLPTYQTALHIATSEGHAKVVKLLCDVGHPHQQRLRCHEEDEEDLTPLDIIYHTLNRDRNDRDSLDIEQILLRRSDVQDGIKDMLQNRQDLVQAMNTILVGAALIAGVTFAGWLQPPLGYAQYYDFAVPYPAPPDTYDSYLAVQGNLGIKAFVLFNSLSFFFAIATVIVGADATFPPLVKYSVPTIKVMRNLLRRGIKFFIISLVCVLGAFGSAAIVVLPPSLFFRKDLVLSIIIGGGVCSYVLWQFLSRHSTKVQWLNGFIAKYIASILKFANVF